MNWYLGGSLDKQCSRRESDSMFVPLLSRHVTEQHRGYFLENGQLRLLKVDIDAHCEEIDTQCLCLVSAL